MDYLFYPKNSSLNGKTLFREKISRCEGFDSLIVCVYLKREMSTYYVHKC